MLRHDVKPTEHLLTHMQVLIVGGTGFIGTELAHELHSCGHTVTVLSRTPEDANLPTSVATVAGDVTDYDSIEATFEDQTVVVNLVALSPLFTPAGGKEMHDQVHLGGTRHVVQAAEAHGVRKLVQMSALGADPNGPTAYLRAKGMAEAVVRESALDSVIIRPSVVFGDGGEFLEFTRTLTTPYVTGLPGGGGTRFQPIWVGDLVPILADAVEGDDHVGHVYELGGPDVLTLADVAKQVYRADGQSLVVLPIPMSLARIGLSIADVLPSVRMGPDQFRALQMDNTVSKNDVIAFGRKPSELRPLADYLAATKDAATSTSDNLGRVFAGRDVWIALASILGFIVLARSVVWQGLQIPGYLLMVGFDLLQNSLTPGLGSWGFWAGFLLYGYGLAVVAGIVARRLRAGVLNDPTGGRWRYPLAGVLILLGVLAVSVGLFPLVYPVEFMGKSCTSGGQCVTQKGIDSTAHLFAIGVGIGLLGLSLGILLPDVIQNRLQNTV